MKQEPYYSPFSRQRCGEPSGGPFADPSVIKKSFSSAWMHGPLLALFLLSSAPGLLSG